VTTGTLSNVVCVVQLAGRTLCNVNSGLNTLSGRYTNATSTLNVDANTTSLLVTNATGQTCPLGDNLTGSLTALVARVTSSPAPVLTLS